MDVQHICPTCLKQWRGHEDRPDYCSKACSDLYSSLFAVVTAPAARQPMRREVALV